MGKIATGFLLWCCLVVEAQAANYYVATSGNDSNSGTSVNAPFKTISQAVNKVVAGDTVFVRGGTYREDVEMVRGGTAALPVRVLPYQSEVPILKGSDLVTGWVQHSGSIWKKTGWAVNSQQVFVDFDARPDKSLQQIGMPAAHYGAWEYPTPVGSGVSTMTAGSFYWDGYAKTLYVWLRDGSNPNNHVMEASVRQRVFHMAQPYVSLRGFSFRHSNTSAFMPQGAAVELSSHSTIGECDIQYMDFAGLSMGYQQDGALALNCNVSNNGNSGINAVSSTNFLISKTKMNYNNSRNFNPLWHAGGFKAATRANGTIVDSEVAFNAGSGIWFDFCDSGRPISVRSNYVHDNGPKEAAVFIEVSSNAVVLNNVITNNARRGVYVSASHIVSVVNNTIAGTTDRSAIEVAGMPRANATLTDNVVQNNIISAAGGSGQYDIFLQEDNGSTIARNRSDFNFIHRSFGQVALYKGKLYTDLTSWRAGTGNDVHSLNGDPLFVAAGATGVLKFQLLTGSSAINTGISLGTMVPDDYLHALRPATGVDIGAFEKKP
jgi:parallel beta-helix repeat protein